MNRADIGRALDAMVDDVRKQTLSLASQYRDAPDRLKESLIKQAIDTPQRARAQIQGWIAEYNARRGSGAQAFLASCLTAAGSTKTIASINSEIATIESAMQTIVSNVAGGWTWDQAASATEAAVTVAIESEDFSYLSLPVPSSYVTVWGEPW